MKKRIEIVLFCLLITIALFKWVRDFIIVDEIKKYEATTIGTIIDYYLVGEASPYVKYEFDVGGIKYIKTETPIVFLVSCEKTKNCIGGKYLVRYSKKNPKNSELLIK